MPLKKMILLIFGQFRMPMASYRKKRSLSQSNGPSVLLDLPTEVWLRVSWWLTAEDILNIIKIPEFLDHFTAGSPESVFSIVFGSRDTKLQNNDIFDGLCDVAGVEQLYLDEISNQDDELHFTGGDVVKPGNIVILCLGTSWFISHRDWSDTVIPIIAKWLETHTCYLFIVGDAALDDLEDYPKDDDQEFNYIILEPHDAVFPLLNNLVSTFLKTGNKVYISSFKYLTLEEITFDPTVMLCTKDMDQIYLDNVNSPMPDFHGELQDPAIMKRLQFNERAFHGLKTLGFKVRDVTCLKDYQLERYESLSNLKIELGLETYDDLPMEMYIINAVKFPPNLKKLSLSGLVQLKRVQLPESLVELKLALETLENRFPSYEISDLLLPRTLEQLYIGSSGDIKISNVDFISSESQPRSAESNDFDEDKNTKLITWFWGDANEDPKDWIFEGCDGLLKKIRDLKILSCIDVLTRCFNENSHIHIFNDLESLEIDSALRLQNPLSIEDNIEILHSMVFPKLKRLSLLDDRSDSLIPYVNAPVLEELVVYCWPRVQGSDPRVSVFPFIGRYPTITKLEIGLNHFQNYDDRTLRQVLSDWSILPNLESLILRGISLCQAGEGPVEIPQNIHHLTLIDCLETESESPEHRLLRLTSVEGDPKTHPLRLESLTIKSTYLLRGRKSQGISTPSSTEIGNLILLGAIADVWIVPEIARLDNVTLYGKIPIKFEKNSKEYPDGLFYRWY